MKLQDSYIYPAVFSFYSDLSIGITFPDLPGCVSSASDIAEALYMASDALGVHLSGMEDDNEALPAPSDLLALKYTLQPEQIVVPVSVFMPRYREAVNNKNINKMCTVPAWLVKEAETQHFSFSQILQEGLMNKLGVTYPHSRRTFKHRTAHR